MDQEKIVVELTEIKTNMVHVKESVDRIESRVSEIYPTCQKHGDRILALELAQKTSQQQEKPAASVAWNATKWSTIGLGAVGFFYGVFEGITKLAKFLAGQ